MLFRYPFVAMGSGCEILIAGSDQRKALALVESAVREVARLEAKYSVFRPESFLSALNRDAARGPVALDAETARLLRFAAALHAETQGRFDASVGALHGCWDFRAMRLPDAESLAGPLNGVGWRHVELNGETVRFHHPRTRLDLGGIVKEYAIDAAVAVLAGLGVRRGLVNLGGDLRVIGRVALDARPFRVGVAHPRRTHATVGSLLLREGALVTSGDYQRYFLRDGRRYHHLLDPRTGWPLALAFPGVTAHGATALEALRACKRILLTGRTPRDDSEGPGAFVACDADGEAAAWRDSERCRLVLGPRVGARQAVAWSGAAGAAGAARSGSADRGDAKHAR